jgi:hypothetical protein
LKEKQKMSNKDAYMAKLKAKRDELAAAAQEQEIPQPQVDAKAGAPVAPEQVPPKEDADEIERLRAEVEALKQAKQTDGNAAVEDEQIEALPAERLEKYRDAFGDDVAELLAEDLAPIRRDSKIKARELETKLKQSERFNEYVGKVEKTVLETFHSPEFQEFAKAQKLGRKLTLADELNEINTTNDVEGTAYLTEQVNAWLATQKATRRASSSSSAPVQRFASAPVGVSQAELTKLKDNVMRQRPGSPGFVEAKAAYDKARTQIIEGLAS